MPKQKTRQAAAKRFKVTANGKVMHYRSGNSHLQTHKSSQRKRQKRKEKELTGEDKKRVKQMLPNA